MNLPVVSLTSWPQPANEKLAFERGALDFINKTRGVEILARRLRLVAKSGKPAANSEAAAPIVCAALVLSQTTYRAYWNQRGMLASPSSEYDIVHLLVSNVGRYQAYRAIYDLQYYEGFVAGQWAQGYRTNVRSSIKRIRKSFADSTRPSQKSRTPPPTDIAGEV